MPAYTPTSYEIWVTPEYLELTNKTFNLSADDVSHRKLLQYLLFHPTYFEVEKDEYDYSLIIVPRNKICSFYGDLHDGNVVTLLKEFADKTGIVLNLTPYDLRNKKCRAVTPDFSPEFIEESQSQRLLFTQPKQGKVLFDTGETYSSYTVKKKRKKHSEAIMKAYINPEHPASELMRELHSPATLKTLAELLITNQDWVAKFICLEPEGIRKDMFETIYNLLETQPYIRYGDTDGTCRIHAQGYSIFQLPSSLRDVELSGDHIHGLDFTSSQFTIISHLWGVQTGLEFLKSGKKLWVELCGYSGVKYTKQYKPQLKEYFYGLFYGMSRKKRKALLMELFGNTNLEQHPMIREFLKKRRVQVKKIVDAMGVYDAFGTWLGIATSLYDPDATAQERASYHQRISKDASDLLSVVAQSYEMKIMMALFQELKSNKNLKLIAFLHDGLVFKIVNHYEFLETYKKRLVDVVHRASSELLMPLDLEFNDMSDTEALFSIALEEQAIYSKSVTGLGLPGSIS